MPKKIKPVKPLVKMEKAYGAAINNEVLKPLLQSTLNRLERVPRLNAAWYHAIETEFASVMGAEALGVETATVAMDNIRRYHRQRMIENFEKALGVNISAMMPDLKIRHIMEKAIAKNVDLITTIPKDMYSKVLIDLEKAITTGFDQEAFLKILNKRFKNGSNKAKLIARDQTSKTIGNLTEARQTDMGVKSYIWLTMDDESVVGNPSGEYPVGNPVHMNHFERNGIEFFWSAPPPDGHPGQPIN